MKAQSIHKESGVNAVAAAAAKSLLRGTDVGRIGKVRTSGNRASTTDASNITEEMQVYFAKLKELVPFMPKNKKLSKLEIIQYVIDYICDLQLALEVHPAAGSPSSPRGGNSSPVSGNRQPLGVIAIVPSNTATALSHTCAAQEANHDKIPSHLDEINTRPVSC